MAPFKILNPSWRNPPFVKDFAFLNTLAPLSTVPNNPAGVLILPLVISPSTSNAPSTTPPWPNKLEVPPPIFVNGLGTVS